jgi:signal transduction histidine kinase
MHNRSRGSHPGAHAPRVRADHFGAGFDAFFTTKSSGMGIGLAIRRSIIESHRGRIRVTRSAMEGSVFQFMLPAGGPADEA